MRNKNLVVLELPPSPFFHSDGREILRNGAWRKHLLFDGGKMRGVSIGCNVGRSAAETLDNYSKQGVKFFADGTWQSEFSTSQAQIDGLPEIKPEVWAEIIGAAGVSPLPCQ